MNSQGTHRDVTGMMVAGTIPRLAIHQTWIHGNPRSPCEAQMFRTHCQSDCWPGSGSSCTTRRPTGRATGRGRAFCRAWLQVDQLRELARRVGGCGELVVKNTSLADISSRGGTWKHGGTWWNMVEHGGTASLTHAETSMSSIFCKKG